MSERVVIVDDEPVHNLLLGLILEQAGYEARACESAAEALAEVARGCDCLITDYHMPGMTGGQLIRAVRKMSSALCIVLTGSDGNGVEQDAMAGGAVAVLRKPTPPERILQLVGALLRPQHGTPKTSRQSANRVEKTSVRRAANFC